jgi:photosystem II stability/assembly factor-like uncharacterized protein
MYKTALLILVAALLFWMSSGTFAQGVPELLYYKFNEGSGSTTANHANPGVGNNPANVLGQTLTGTGQFGAGLLGNGGGSATNSVQTGWSTNLGTGAWTISCWVNNLPVNTTLYYLFGDAGAASFRCFIGGVAGAGGVALRGGGGPDLYVLGAAPGPTTVTYTYDPTLASNNLKAYFNGVLMSQVTTTAYNINGTGFLVGGEGAGASLPAGGVMDEFRLYNRALDASEVAATWNTELPVGTPGWSEQVSGVTSILRTVKAVSPSIAWAAGAAGVVLRTTNGGNTWSSVGGGAIGTTAIIYNVEALDATTAFVTTSPSSAFTHIFRTTNAGVSWDTVFTQTGTDPFINYIHMFNATDGIAQGDPIGGRWTIVRTSNGGASWERDTVNAPLQVGTEFGANNGMAVRGTTHIWFTPGTGNGFYSSTNGGTTWTRTTLPAAGFTAGIDFINTQYGVVGNSGGVAARTTDGGATWNPVTIGTTGAIYGVGTAGTLDFWTTRGTTIQTSNNRGASWAQDFSNAAAGIFNHADFLTSGSNAHGWAVTSTGKIYAYFNPVNVHDAGVSSLAKVFSTGQPAMARGMSAVDESNLESAGTAAHVQDDQGSSGIAITAQGSFRSADTVGFRAVITNFGTFNEPSYLMGWSINGVNQTPLSGGPIAAGDNDTLTFQWNEAVNGVHVLHAWTSLADDGNSSNDSATLSFNVGRVPGDTLYTFIVPGQIILGVAKMGPSNKLAFTSGGQSSTVTTDNKWIVTDLYGTFLDTTHLQVNPTTGQGFGFRDLDWNGRWLLTSDDTRIRRIDTTTFTEVATPIITPTNPNRGIAQMTDNRIWVSNFTTSPVNLYDTTGATIRSLGVPPVAPYGISFDKWTSQNRGWLWYSQPSTTGLPVRLSKVDTSNGALVQTFDYGAIAGTAISGGLNIVNDHPDYPGMVVGFLVGQRFPTSICLVIYLGQDSTVVGVAEGGTGTPDAYALLQNYPNPFNPTTTIQYDLPVRADVTVKIYSVLGQEVATVAQGQQGPGRFEATWDGRSPSGALVGSGVYFYRFEASGVGTGEVFTSSKKMLLLK